MKIYLLLLFFLSSNVSIANPTFGFLYNSLNKRTIILNGSVRHWSDGSFAGSCKEYLNSGKPSFQYSGAIGDGIYRIKPSGAAASMDVQCDMTTYGGGWTLVFKDSTNDSSNSTKNYMSQSSTIIGSLSTTEYKANSSQIIHTQSMFKATQSTGVYANFNDLAFVIINKTLSALTGTSDSTCGPYQFDNQGCEMASTPFDYYSLSAGAISASSFNPTGGTHAGAYWFGDTVNVNQRTIYTYYSTEYRYIWHKNGLSLGSLYYAGSTPTTVYRSIWIR